MESRRVRLGDVIDDYCPRCRLIMNHGVVGMIGDDVKKVRCNTCLSEHVFRHGQLPARRKAEAAKLFKEVLQGIAPSGDAAPPDDAAPSPPPPVNPQRRLYTIRRTTGGKGPGKGGK
jgi:hypothetical protein